MISLPSRSGRIAASSSCSAQRGDARLELVVGARPAAAALRWLRVVQSARVSLCSRSSSGPASRDVAAHRRVGPLARRRSRGSAGAARPAGRRRRRPRLEYAAPQPLPGHASRPTTSWWWKETPPPGSNAPGRAACRCRAAARPAAAPGRARRPRSSVDRLLEHGQRVLVDVLVPVVLVDLQPQPRQLGQHVRRPARCRPAGSSPRRGSRARAAAWPARPDPLGGDDRRSRSAIAAIAAAHLGRDREAELGGEPGRPQHPQRVVGEGVLRACPGCAAPGAARSSQAAERVDELVAPAAAPPSR